MQLFGKQSGKSECIMVKCGVPQRAVLRPKLFILRIKYYVFILCM